MFLFFSRHVLCDFMFFKTSNLDKMIKNSYIKPTFVVAYSKTCEGCDVFPAELKKFRKMSSKRKDFFFSTVDCDNGWKCYSDAFNVPNTPYMAVIQGPKMTYWQETKNRTAEAWMELVDSVVAPKATLIQNDDEIEQYREKIDGGSLFILHVSSENSKILKEYKQLAKENYIYGCKFVYKISFNQKLIAYTSKNCFHKCNNLQKLPAFIERFKFATNHMFTSEELPQLLSYKENTALLLIEKPYNNPRITDGTKGDLTDLAGMYCGKMRVNAAALDYSDDFKKGNQIQEDDLPQLLFFNSKCVNKYKGRFSDSLNTDFYNVSLSGELCSNVYNNIDGSQNITTFNSSLVSKKKMWWQKTVTGFTAHIYYLITGFVVLLYVVIRTPHREKTKEK